jgi:hypothetical protein
VAPTAPVTAQRVRDGEPAALHALVDRRGAAVLAYCERVAEPDRAVAAAGDAFGRFRHDVVAAAEPRKLDPEALLLRGTRLAAAAAAPRTVPPRGLLARRLGATCMLVPELLAARAEGTLSPADRLRLGRHLERCDSCREAEDRFEAGERAYQEAPSAPPAPDVAGELLAALRAAAPNAPAAPAEVAMMNGAGLGPPPVIPAEKPPEVIGGEPATVDAPPLAWDASDREAAAGEAPPRWTWLATRMVVPALVFAAAFVVAMAVAGIFGGGDGGGPSGSIETQSVLPTPTVRVLARPTTTPLPPRTTGSAATGSGQGASTQSGGGAQAGTVNVSSSSAPPATSLVAAQPQPQLSARIRRRSETSAPPPGQPATVTTPPAFQPAPPPAPAPSP